MYLKRFVSARVQRICCVSQILIPAATRSTVIRLKYSMSEKYNLDTRLPDCGSLHSGTCLER